MAASHVHQAHARSPLLQSQYRGEEGLNIIPQWAYWKTLPGLVKDGCIYSYRHGGRALKNAPRDIKECWNGRNTKELREPIAYTAATE